MGVSKLYGRGVPMIPVRYIFVDQIPIYFSMCLSTFFEFTGLWNASFERYQCREIKPSIGK